MEQVMQDAQKMEQVLQNAQKVALPAYLRRGLVAFRVSNGNRKKYLLKASWNGSIYEFEPWQFFILEVLPGCNDFSKLASVFEDRFGHQITKNELQKFFSMVADKKLFGLAAISHPLLASFEKTRKAPIVAESPQEVSSNLKVGKNNSRAGAAASEEQARPAAAIHTGSNHRKRSGPAAKANQGPLPSDEHKHMDLMDALGIPAPKTHGYLARAVHKAQKLDSSDKRRAMPHVESRPAAASPPMAASPPAAASSPARSSPAAEAADRGRRIERAKPQLRADLPVAESKKSNGKAELKPAAKTVADQLPAGVRDAVGLDDTMRKKGWKLFNPTWLIKLFHPILLPFRHTIYLLPLILTAALFICARHTLEIEADVKRFLIQKSFIEHALLSMVTVNLAVTMVTALVAYTYRASVTGFCIVFYMLFFPRFMVRIGNVQQLSRRERIWLHAAPLLLRLGFFSVGILVWFGAKTMHTALANFALAVAFAGAISFLITISPFLKSNGCHLLSAFLNEPHLRKKAFKALLNKLRGNVYSKADSAILVGFALTSILYLLAITIGMLYVFNRYLEIQIGPTTVLLIGCIAIVLLWRMILKFKDFERDYERSAQFERWRKQILPQAESDTTEKEPRSAFFVYLRRAVFFLFLALLFLPYNYEPGGNFIILPNEQQTITAEIAGIVEKINFDGGEFIKKGTVIGQLSYSDYEAQVKILDAKIEQQQAALDELKSKPKPEEVRLARSALETQKTRAAFSKGKADRLKDLYDQGVVSFEDYDDARRTAEVDIDQVKEKISNLELVESGATPEELAEAEAKLKSYKEERNLQQEKIEQSVFYMPFDGKLKTLHLKQKTGSYLHKGDALAVAEQASQVKVEIEVAETDIDYIRENSTIRCRFHVYSDEIFHGKVQAIDTNVTEKDYGKVIKVITLLENKDGRIKSGMTGYAKISSEKMPLWKVLSLSLIRFVKVEAWSWLP